MIDFKKTNPTCSNIFLIDQNLCLGNTLNTINYNFSSLQISLSGLERYNNDWYNLYTIFSSYSAKWIRTATNIQTFSAKWIDTTTTVNSLSSRWGKSFTLYYPTMININTWNSYSTSVKNSVIVTWLNNFFKASEYASDQIVEVVVYLNQNQQFSFRFNRSYNESCTPNGGGIVVTCTGCPLPSRGCNRKGRGCFNAFTECRRSISGRASFSCTGTGGRRLTVGMVRTATDKNIARTVVLKYKNINNRWTAI